MVFFFTLLLPLPLPLPPHILLPPPLLPQLPYHIKSN